MIVTVTPAHLSGNITAPPSKSMAHRYLIAAAMADGVSVIDGISDSEDMKATISLITALGATVTKEGSRVTVKGTDVRHAHPTSAIDCRECGSTLRFAIPVCMLSPHEMCLTGSTRLFERPLSLYKALSDERGLAFAQEGNALTVKGCLSGGHYTLQGDVSSQFVTGLLLALPLCEEDSTLTLLPPVESRPYIDLTLSALRAFGVSVEMQDSFTYLIKGGQAYKACTVTVEGDASNAVFFDALSYLGHDVTVAGLPDNCLQGDIVYRDILPLIAKKDEGDISLAACPDLGPILMAMAGISGYARFTDTRRLRLKESDRAEAMRQELAKFGVTVAVEENRVTVDGSGFHAPNGMLCGHGDHRIVMALTTLLTVTGGSISGASAVSKSMPDYFDRLTALGGKITYEA